MYNIAFFFIKINSFSIDLILLRIELWQVTLLQGKMLAIKGQPSGSVGTTIKTLTTESQVAFSTFTAVSGPIGKNVRKSYQW